MKSYETTVLPLYAGILEDAYTRWPDVRRSAERDYSRLSKTIENRGVECVTLLFPATRHWFDKSLDAGRLLESPPIPRGMRIFRGRPLLFAGILDKIFDDDGVLRESADPWAVLCYRTLLSVCGKLEIAPSEATLHRSVKEFCNVEDTLARLDPQTAWREETPARGSSQSRSSQSEPDYDVGSGPGNPVIPGKSSSWGSHLWEPSEPFSQGGDNSLYSAVVRPGFSWDTFRQLCRRVVSELGGFDPYALSPKHGPGAVSERNVVDKYDFRFWPDSLNRVFPMTGTALAIFSLHRTRSNRKSPRG
jgi:hypothetical protein